MVMERTKEYDLKMKSLIYAVHGPGLYDNHNRKIAFMRGEEIYNSDNQLIGTLRDNCLYDSDNRPMMFIRGGFIFDAKDVRVGSLLEVQKLIEGGREKNLFAALWYCFIR